MSDAISLPNERNSCTNRQANSKYFEANSRAKFFEFFEENLAQGFEKRPKMTEFARFQNPQYTDL